MLSSSIFQQQEHPYLLCLKCNAEALCFTIAILKIPSTV